MPSPESDAAVRRRLQYTQPDAVSVLGHLLCAGNARGAATSSCKSSSQGMFCVRIAVRSSLSIPERSCPARARTPLARLSRARLVSARRMRRERPLAEAAFLHCNRAGVVRAVPQPRHAALHTLTACVVPCRRMLAGPTEASGEPNGTGRGRPACRYARACTMFPPPAHIPALA